MAEYGNDAPGDIPSAKESQVAKVRQLSNREPNGSSERLVRKVKVKPDKAQDVVAEEQLLLFSL